MRKTWSRPSGIVGAFVTMAVLIAACSSTAMPTASTPKGSTPPEAASSSTLEAQGWIFDVPAEPVDVGVVLDTDQRAEAVVPVAGGTLTATGADGTVYTLEIPPDALLIETTIGLTPVASISDMPFGGENAHAVQLSPDGLFLFSSAILTITPVDPIPVNEQIVFGYLEDGKDLILAPPVVDSNEIKIHVLHFSGNGATRGLLADIEPERLRLGGDIERRLSDALSAELQRTRQEGGEWQGASVAAAFEAAFLEYEEQVVRPRVAAAGESCANARLALQTVNRLEGMRQQLLLTGDGGDALANYPGLLDTSTRVCVVEEFELCVEEHVIHRMRNVWLGFERQYVLTGRGGMAENAVLREARDLTVECLTFRLDFESTGTVGLQGLGGYESRVTSEITLRYNPDDDTLSGDAPLVNEAFDWFLPACTATAIRGGGDFDVMNLRILSNTQELEAEVGFLLSYVPGETSESAVISCPDGPSQTIPPGPYWKGIFVVTHEAELDAGARYGGGYLAIDWEVFGDEYFAKKEWTKNVEDFVEAGSFELHHTPGG